jgi:hypothetical protein
MGIYPRYAIYYAPAPGGVLDRFGADLLGYDAYRGDDLPFPAGVTLARPDWRDLTQDPRKYGFHATLKAPMALPNWPRLANPSPLRRGPFQASSPSSIRSAALSPWCRHTRRLSCCGSPRM